MSLDMGRTEPTCATGVRSRVFLQPTRRWRPAKRGSRLRRVVVTATASHPRAIDDFRAVLRQSFTRPRLVAIVLLGPILFYVFVCYPEQQFRLHEPDSWQLVYGSAGVPPMLRCALCCFAGAMAGLLPLLAVLF